MAHPKAQRTDIAAIRDFVTTHAHEHAELAQAMDDILAAARLAQVQDPPAFVDIVCGFVLGGYLDVHGHTPDLLAMLDAVIETVRVDPSAPHTLHVLLSKRGNAHHDQGELDLALRCYREALDLAPNLKRRAVVMGAMGRALARHDRFDEADICFNQANRLAEEAHDDVELLRILEMRSDAAFRAKRFALARDIAVKGRELSRRIEAHASEGAFLLTLGSAHFELGVRASTTQHHDALRIAQATSNNDLRAVAHEALGIDHHAMEEFEEAADHLNRALKLYRDLGYTENEKRVVHMMRRFGYPHTEPEVVP